MLVDLSMPLSPSSIPVPGHPSPVFEPLHLIAPRPGRLVLFPSFLHHGTRAFAAGERLTVAFDVNPDF